MSETCYPMSDLLHRACQKRLNYKLGQNQDQRTNVALSWLAIGNSTRTTNQHLLQFKVRGGD
jgi:hypothetical protein